MATIGTATIAAAIGGGGLGTFHFSRARDRWITQTILAGAIPAALMALAADEVLGWVERRFACLIAIAAGRLRREAARIVVGLEKLHRAGDSGRDRRAAARDANSA